MQLHELLVERTDHDPDAPYVRAPGWKSYAEVTELARHLAGYLVRDAGVERGSRVGLFWRNSAEAVAASFGIWMAGGVLVPLSTDLRGEALLHQIRHSDASVVIAGPSEVRRLIPISHDLSRVHIVYGTEIREAQGDPPRVPLTPEEWRAWDTVTLAPRLKTPVRSIDVDLAAIVYTSGSTGTPKGVMLSHLNLISNTRSIVSYLKLERHDRVMMVLPHFYIYGLSLILTHTMCGGSIVMDNRFMYPDTVLQQMVSSAVSGFAGVPSTFAILLERSSVSTMRFPALRYVTQAGGAMPVSVQKEVARVFSPARLFVMYGATEASPRLAYLDPGDLTSRWGSVGKAVPNVDLYVAGETGRRLESGEEGEIVARGSNIMSGYWKDPAGSAEVLHHGLYFTGDRGVMDQEGFVYVTGRVREMIKVKGYRVSPREIEDFLVEHGPVAEAAVVGVPDRLLGESPVAFVVLTEETCLNDLQREMRFRMPPYKVPAHWVVLEELPHTAAGKIDKRVLKRKFTRGEYERRGAATVEA